MSRHLAAGTGVLLLAAAVAFPANAAAQDQPRAQEQHDPHQHHHHAAPPAPPANPDKTEKADGLKFPDVSLLDQNGRTVDFYDDLEMDNTKSFWTAHKELYESAVKQPMQALLVPAPRTRIQEPS